MAALAPLAPLAPIAAGASALARRRGEEEVVGGRKRHPATLLQSSCMAGGLPALVSGHGTLPEDQQPPCPRKQPPSASPPASSPAFSEASATNGSVTPTSTAREAASTSRKWIGTKDRAAALLQSCANRTNGRARRTEPIRCMSRAPRCRASACATRVDCGCEACVDWTSHDLHRHRRKRRQQQLRVCIRRREQRARTRC